MDCERLGMVYEVDGEAVVALDEVSFSLRPGDEVAIIGPSGSGKSTLTALLSGLRRPTSGTVRIDGSELSRMSVPDLLRMRRTRIGIVLQNPSRSLLPYGTAEGNIRFAQLALPAAARRTLPTPRGLLDRLGLGSLADERAARLSGGEQQRLAVAVGLANAPSLLLADEPTSQLDEGSRDGVVALINRAAREFAVTTVVVTHDRAVADAMDQVLTMREGRLAPGEGASAAGSRP